MEWRIALGRRALLQVKGCRNYGAVVCTTHPLQRFVRLLSLRFGGICTTLVILRADAFEYTLS